MSELVQPGTSKCAETTQPSLERNSWARPSVKALSAALLQLYATLPGGFVIPCFDPVLTTHDGLPTPQRSKPRVAPKEEADQ